MRIPSSQWATLFTRLSIVVIFLAVPVAFTLGPFLMPYHTPALFDYLCFALRLILLFASPVLNRDTTEKTNSCDLTPTMQNTVILQCVLSNLVSVSAIQTTHDIPLLFPDIVGLLAAMIGEGKLIEPERYDNLYTGLILVTVAGTAGELFIVALMCYAGDEAKKLVCSDSTPVRSAHMDLSANSFNRQPNTMSLQDHTVDQYIPGGRNTT